MQLSTPHASPDLFGRFLQGLGDAANAPLGLAVSGGGDSMAMLHLAAGAGLKVRAVTVDHGLRSDAADEAAMVGRVCADMGIAHAVLQWHWNQKGNLLDQARRARRALIGDWARQAGLSTVAVGHTEDDIAETFLMRLARGAGVDGLAAMVPEWAGQGITWRRPLLSVSRAELRAYLRALGVGWVDDPSNDAPQFERVKARKALLALAPLGLSAARLAEVAAHLSEARAALEIAGARAAGAVLREDQGAVLIDVVRLAAEPEDMQRRVLLRILDSIAPTEFGPRGSSLTRIRAAVLAGRPGQLAGVRFLPGKAGARAFRDAQSVKGAVAGPTELWDGRWRLHGPWLDAMQVRALGVAGLVQCDGWRATGRPRAELAGSPSVWLGTRLIAAPLAGFGLEWRAEPAGRWVC